MVLGQGKVLLWTVLICVSSQDEKGKEITPEKAMKHPETEGF